MKTQYWKLDVNTLKWLHQKNLITATAYVLGIIRATRSQGWKWTFKVDDFCKEWGISERSFYRAISFLKTNNLVQWKVKGEIVIWWSEENSSMPDVAEVLPQVAETMPDVAEVLPQVAETAAEICSETESYGPNNSLTTNLIDSLTHSLIDIAPATAAPISRPNKESEKNEFGFQIPGGEEVALNNSFSLLNQSEFVETTKSSIKTIVPAQPQTQIKKINYDPALGMRPPRQRPKYRYPEGPWLNESGQINEDFIRDRAALWRTGDNANSKSFGSMAIEDVLGLVAGHYQRTENHAKLEIDWQAYVAKNQRYVTNVQTRLEAGIGIPDEEQQKILQKAPALMAEPLESAYGVASPKVKPKLEPEILIASAAPDATNAAQKNFRNTLMPENAEDAAMYTRTAKPKDADYFRKLHEGAVANRQTPKISSDCISDIKKQINELAKSKQMFNLNEQQRQRMKEQDAVSPKLAYWNSLLQNGIPSVIADVKRRAYAEGYEIVDGRVFEVDF